MHELAESADHTAEEVEALLRRAHEEALPSFPPPIDFSAYAKKVTGHARIAGLRADGTLVAFLAFYCNDPERRLAYMSMLLVRSDYRGRGLARRLVQQSLDYLTQAGFIVYRLEVGKDNREAIALYKAMGFTETGQEKEASLFMERSVVRNDAEGDARGAKQAMSLKANVLANYGGQIYTTVANLAMVPIYLHYMGAEAYGLVGFFAMLQMWFQLLDLGLTPTISRESARLLGGGTTHLKLRQLLRALEGIFVAIALLGAAVLMLSADAISVHWLSVQGLSLTEVRHAVMLMAILISLRWLSGLYRGVISGLEKQVWLNVFNVTSTTFRCALIVPFFLLTGSSPTQFFLFQVIVAAVETGWLIRKTYQLLPLQPRDAQVRWELAPLRSMLGFSLSVAFTSSVWILVTQTDKLVLSKLLPLTQYGYFTLAVLAASGVMLISGPINIAVQPRITRIAASGDEAGMIQLYRKATQLVAVLCLPAALILVFFSEKVLWAWTGNMAITRDASEVLSLYAAGNGILIFSAFPFLLQFAKGRMELHVLGNILLVMILIPSLIWATINYGMTGAGYAWLISNAAFFLFWIPLVHKRFLKGLHLQWLSQDIGFIIFPPLLTIFFLQEKMSWPENRLAIAFLLFCIFIVLTILAAFGSSYARGMFPADFYKKRSISLRGG